MCRSLGLLSAAVLLMTGCTSTPAHKPGADDHIPSRLTLFAGDVVEINFPGATNMNSIRRIGPEGTINMPLVGQIQAAGKTGDELQAEVSKLYKNELRESTVIVNVSSSANSIYVTGAVLRPGRLALNRPLTAFEAILEAGGFAPTANRKRVTIIRYEGDQNTSIELDLDPLLKGGPVTPFYMKPRDVLHVPPKLQWF